MKSAVAISVLTGPHKNRRFTFEGPVRFTVGRAEGCLIRFSGDNRDLMISRRHCEVKIDPPHAQLRDLGSLNGTYLNGKRLEPTKVKATGRASSHAKLLAETLLNDGDVVTLGGMSFRIDLIDLPVPAKFELGDDSAKMTAARANCATPC
jgi:pSer/pThr/pTyr-binding forkhead associated (FHA) protein